MSEYRLSFCKTADGRVLFSLAAMDGEVLVPWREMAGGLTVDRAGGMTAGPSDGSLKGKTLHAVHAAVPSPPWREDAADMGLEVFPPDITVVPVLGYQSAI